MSFELVILSNHLILYRPLLLLPSVFSSIRVFSNELVLDIRWPKYWSFSFNIGRPNEYSGLISFRMDLLDILAVQGTLKSSPTPQFKSINSSALSFLYNPTLTSIGEGNGNPLQYSCLENPMDGGAWWAAVHGVTRSWTQLNFFTFPLMHWIRKWQPTPVFLPGESQGWGSLVGCCLWGCTELDTTEVT